MSLAAALALATPIFGMQLSIDPAFATGPSMSGAQVAGPAITALPAPVPDDESGSASSGPSVGEQMAQRNNIRGIHRILGITTWASMTLTVALGWLQYANLYGPFQSAENTRCVQGNAFFGQNSCIRQPLPHLISSTVTATLYTATFALSLMMPDPLNIAEQDTDAGRTLRRHKRLRWVHTFGMVAQMLLGVVIANADRFGLDRANDYAALNTLSTVHMLIGMTTYATMTWAGVLYL